MRPAPPPPPETLKRRAVKADDRRYRFLTYVFGGGVSVRDHEKPNDSVTPVRAASVRGQLRFWWRACNPSGCKTVEELRQREGEIWGSTSQPSKVEVIVLSQPPSPQRIAIYRYDQNDRLAICDGMRDIAYGAFPLQPSRDEQRHRASPGALYDYGNSPFTLRFLYPEEIRADVEAALWAWESFGGLGGRTRRGFGAIVREGSAGYESVRSTLSRYQDTLRLDPVPSLAKSRLAASREPHTKALEAWKAGLKLLQKIRQGPGAGRNPPQPGTPRPAGRSRWPEPDQIRHLTGQSAPLHENPVVTVPCFPRAAFGMPIVFHFHPGSPHESGSAGDPGMKPLQLQPEASERFASPLILRPIPDGQGFRTIALALSSDVPAAELVAGSSRFSVDTDLTPELAASIPALCRNGKAFTNPIDLFLEELQK